LISVGEGLSGWTFGHDGVRLHGWTAGGCGTTATIAAVEDVRDDRYAVK